jgi:hypothetical protein
VLEDVVASEYKHAVTRNLEAAGSFERPNEVGEDVHAKPRQRVDKLNHELGIAWLRLMIVRDQDLVRYSR